jgi:hypothetical protein
MVEAWSAASAMSEGILCPVLFKQTIVHNSIVCYCFGMVDLEAVVRE